MDAICKRRFSHGGTEYRAGQRIKVSAAQFADWLAVGLVEKARQSPVAVKRPVVARRRVWPEPKEEN